MNKIQTNMGKKILLVGCGNIGSRHLESLLKYEESLYIIIIEPNSESKKSAKILISKNANKLKHNIIWMDSFGFEGNIDLAIIATSAINRIKIVQDLLYLGIKNFILEKMVCQSNYEYVQLINNINQFNAKAWINTNRRYFPLYQQIKNFIKNNNLKINVRSQNKGLGSNALHFIDLFQWYLNSTEIKLNGDMLDDKIYSNKRGNDYVEFAGKISGQIENSSLEIFFSPSENLPLTVEIISDELHLIINENYETIEKIIVPQNLDLKFKYMHVSDLTVDIVTDIFRNSECRLPSLNQLYVAHIELFRIFNLHIKKLTNKEPQNCPIT